jgi:uncharacterized protein YcnI
MRMRRLFPLALVLAASPVWAHIVIAEAEGQAGSYHVAAFRVGHGCNGSPMVSLRIEIPSSITGAKPQAKPGWIMRVERASLAQPIAGENGIPQSQRVSAVTWMGRLDSDQFDEFKLLVKLPDAAGPLYFPALQRCEQGEAAWMQIPARGQSWHDLKQPAPMLQVTKGAAPAAHR